jgi:beta-phosphoglucomutase-like phosphatase (HAD superfamily)
MDVEIIKANHVLFFDMDGTLVNTDYANFLSYKRAIETMQKSVFNTPYDSAHRFNRSSLKKAFPNITDTELTAIIHEKESCYEYFLSETFLNTSVVSILLEHSMTNRTVLITNCRKERTLSVLNYHKLTNEFSDMFCLQQENDSKGRNKYRDAILHFGISPCSVVVFENEKSEIANAIAAGITIINPLILLKMNTFTINKNGFLKQSIQAFYHQDYIRMGAEGNPDFINHLKNQYKEKSDATLIDSTARLYEVLKENLPKIKERCGTDLTVCVVPRAKKESFYTDKQKLFRKTVSDVVNGLDGFHDGTNYIIRHTDTRTTHLDRSGHGGDGKMPYIGITKDSCNISDDVKGKDILLIDDIYTETINIDEDAIQALLDKGARSVIFYAIGKTVHT